MKLSIERNNNTDEAIRERIPWLIVVEIESETADTGRLYKIPVHVRYVGVLKYYSVRVCGVRLEAPDKPAKLFDRIQSLLKTLLNGSRFPTYMFLAKKGGHLFPAYSVGDDVFVTTAGGGPVFRHVELAKVREYLTDYLHTIKVVGQKGQGDKLSVRGVDTETFGLKRPVFYLKKRNLREVPFWAPVFENQARNGIYTIAANARREVSLREGGDGREVFHLRDIVAHVLQADKRLNDLFDLRTDRIMTSYWSRLEPTLDQGENVSINGHHLIRYHAPSENLHMIAEPRPFDEQRVGLYFGKSMDDVFERTRLDFERRDALHD